MFEKMCQMPNLYVLVSNILAMRHIAVPKARKDGIKHLSPMSNRSMPTAKGMVIFRKGLAAKEKDRLVIPDSPGSEGLADKHFHTVYCVGAVLLRFAQKQCLCRVVCQVKADVA